MGRLAQSSLNPRLLPTNGRIEPTDGQIKGENVVVWYTLNYHHLPRPEDWPVQPVVYAGFHWMPEGFFEADPALDVPPPTGKAHYG